MNFRVPASLSIASRGCSISSAGSRNICKANPCRCTISLQTNELLPEAKCSCCFYSSSFPRVHRSDSVLCAWSPPEVIHIDGFRQLGHRPDAIGGSISREIATLSLMGGADFEEVAPM